MIKAVLFDLGGVVFTRGMTQFTKYVAEKHGRDQKAIYESLKSSALLNAYYEGKISRDEFYASLKENLQIDDDVNELEQKLFEVYQVIQETKQIVQKVRSKNKVYFLSDNFKERVEYADKKYGFISWFDGGVFSHVVGVRKPNKKIYEIAIKEVGLRPEQMLFIDDKEINLPPANELGIKTLLYKDPIQLENELKRMKIV
ncbi:MAG TPA: HAD family phosphatase [Candidatus Saccharimonadales bacterium]|nr:HAD family phosphatase [Candidatus Saccharimonadales bacterium]